MISLYVYDFVLAFHFYILYHRTYWQLWSSVGLHLVVLGSPAFLLAIAGSPRLFQLSLEYKNILFNPGHRASRLYPTAVLSGWLLELWRRCADVLLNLDFRNARNYQFQIIETFGNSKGTKSKVCTIKEDDCCFFWLNNFKIIAALWS